MTGLRCAPIGLAEANAFVGIEHRHNAPVRGHKWSLGAYVGDRLVGVVIVGRTIAAGLHTPTTCEVLRCCTDGTWNACSFLYQRARRVAQAMGYDSCLTYSRQDESGASLRAVGACCEAELDARRWSTANKKRVRVDKSEPADRWRWELIKPETPRQRPVLRYHGGKWRIAPWVISHFPAHRVYVEPFGGGGSVLLRKSRSDFEVYNDLDADVVNVFRVLRDPERSLELERQLRFTPWARSEFEASYLPTADPIERARRTIVRCFMGHGTTSRRKNRTGFRAGSHPNRKGGGFGDWSSYHDAVPAFTARLLGVVIEERPALDLIARQDASDALFYVDPPYPASTRSAVRGPGDHDRCYTHEMSDDDHRELAAVLARCLGAVVLSGYACPLYDDELYVGWERHERHVRADHGVARTEVLWIKPAGVQRAPPIAHVQSSFDLLPGPT